MTILGLKKRLSGVFASRSKANALYLTFYSALTRGTTFIVVFLFAKYLGPADFGLFSLVTSTALLFSSFVGINFSQVIIIQISKSVNESRNINRSLKAVGLVLSFFFAIIFLLYFLFYDQLSASIGINDRMIMGLCLPGLIVISVLSPVLSGFGLGLNIIKQQTLLLIITLPFVGLLLYAYHNKHTLEVALVIYLSIQILLSLSQFRTVIAKAITRSKNYPAENQTVKSISGNLVRSALPLIVGGLFTLPPLWYLQVLLRKIPNGNIELGLYGVANQIRAILFFIIGTVCSAILPSLAVSESYATAKRLALRSMWVLIALTLAAALVFLAAGQFLLQVFYEQYVDAYWSILLIVISTVFTAITSVFSRLAIAISKNKWVLYSNIGFGLSVIIFSLWLVSKGATGAGFVILIASALQALVMLIVLKLAR